MNPTTAPANNLTPTLTLTQLQQNITALQKSGQQIPQVQSYVNQYKNNGDGTYSLTTPPPTATPTTPSNQNNLFGSGNANIAGGNFGGPLSANSINNAGSDIANSITGGIQTFGKALSTIGSSAPSEANDINAKDNASKEQLLLAIHNQPDVTMKQHLMDAYNKIWGGKEPLTAGDINPAFNLSKEQVIGAAGETALDALSGGTLAGETAPATGILQGAKTAAITGGEYGAGFGATQGMQNNDTPLGVAGSAIAGGTIGAAGGAVLGAGLGGAEALSNKVPEVSSKELNAITDKIAPNMDKAQTKLAMNEGRLTRSTQGSVGKTLLGEAPDVVTQSSEVQRATQTIQKNIPGASKMNDSQLYNALDDGVGSKATQLRPVMRTTPVNIDTLSKAQDAWNALKSSQVKEVGASFDNMPGATQMQDKFQNVMDSLNLGSKDTETGKFVQGTAKNMEDVWDARIAYDNSIPKNVKTANSMSTDALQYKKSMWLQNRGILNDVMNDAETGLGNTSRKAFAEMNDMYSAKQSVLSKVAKPTQAGEGILGKGGKLNIKTLGKNVAKYAGIGTLGWIGNGIIHDVTGLP